MSGLLDLIREARRPERTVELCLRGDLVGEYEALDRRRKEIAGGRDDEFGGSGEARRISARMCELREEMHASSVTFHLRSVGPERSAELIAGHPPRKDDDRDKVLGYNRATLYLALVSECCYQLSRGEERTILRDDQNQPTDQAMTDEDWSGLVGKLSQQQWDRLVNTAWDTDHSDVEVPTLPLALLISQRADESSKQHDAGEPHPESSPGKSDGRSRHTSTTTKGDSSDQ